MGLLDDIREAQSVPDRSCLFYQFMLTMPDDDQQDLKTALGDKSITARAIFIAVRKYGYTGGETVVRRHRRGDCACL